MPVPALVSTELFSAVQEQLAENRQRVRQRQRGARYLLQGLVMCAQCQYAYYGKAISTTAAKGHPRDYAYYRCIGTDAYRFGGERVCTNTQVRTDLLEAAVWQEVCDLLADPARLAADTFGEGNWAPRRYGAFEALADDPDVDAVDVATPPEYHRSVVQMCLDAGKAVVCDLPFATNSDEAADLIALARKRERFLMAGPWMRFLPLSARLRSLLAEGVIGEPRTIIAEVGVLPPIIRCASPAMSSPAARFSRAAERCSLHWLRCCSAHPRASSARRALAR